MKKDVPIVVPESVLSALFDLVDTCVKIENAGLVTHDGTENCAGCRLTAALDAVQAANEEFEDFPDERH